jgi:uncharacterized protein (TIGR02145 family)
MQIYSTSAVTITLTLLILVQGQACSSRGEAEVNAASYEQENPDKEQESISNQGARSLTPVTDKQGHSYAVIAYKNQAWSTSNYKQTIFNNGDVIKEAKNAKEWYESTQKKEPVWCYYLFDSTYKDTFGVYYNAYAINDPRGLSPEGWAMPTQYQTRVFARELQYEGHHLKEKGAWKTKHFVYNSTGFSARPAGLIARNGEFMDVGDRAYFWTQTEKNREENMHVEIDDERNSISFFTLSKELGMAVRLIQQRPNE